MAIDIGSRLELLVDEYLIDRMDGVELTLHRPIPREVAIVHDEPWEGNTCFYHTVFRDGNLYRMYYRGAHYIPETRGFFHQVVCYAESSDGIHWNKPDLGVVEFNGSRRNNIVWDGFGAHNFTPFRDNNPECKPAERYKAIASGSSDREGLFPLKSPDGIHWSLMSQKPVITEGAFDSQNLAFWDTVRGCYAEYHRGQWEAIDGRPETFVRDVMTCTSPDFLNWTDPEFLEYPGSPIQHLYTNQITPYFAAPHIYMGFPKRFVPPALFVPNTPSQPHPPVQVPEGTSRSRRSCIPPPGILTACS